MMLGQVWIRGFGAHNSLNRTVQLLTRCSSWGCAWPQGNGEKTVSTIRRLPSALPDFHLDFRRPVTTTIASFYIGLIHTMLIYSPTRHPSIRSTLRNDA